MRRLDLSARWHDVRSGSNKTTKNKITNYLFFFDVSSTKMTTETKQHPQSDLLSYTLTPDEYKYCLAIAQRRNSTNEKGKVKNANYSGRNDVDIHIQGVIGEFAFLKLHGQDPTPSLDNTKSRSAQDGTDTFDAWIKKENIDVKSVVTPVSELLVPAWKKKHPPNRYVLMRICRHLQAPKSSFTTTEIPPTVFLLGSIDSKTLLQSKYLTQRFNTAMYAFPVNQLMLDVPKENSASSG
jgi:hypothetical protein